MIKRFRFELILAVVLMLFVAWTWHKQEPNAALTRAETDRYLAIVSAKFPMPDRMDRPATLARLRAFAEGDDGRDVYMLNLLRFNDRMASGPAPAGRFKGTPEEANAIYEDNAKPVLMKSGAFPIFSGKVEEANAIGGFDRAEDNWTRVLIVHYPSRRHFFDLLTDPEYLKKADFKSYSMHMALVPVKRELVVPDFRHLALAGAIILFLLIALIRALRSARR
ncbi:hypothetical protein [Novosphingobium sp.]|uniref:hypothetical protein n=1 Tax=Novosphingobium sp. TaxID=1874826 RepID=UPI002734FC45|nr:hypothetical protein [Novosphingobium sp.]MDP3908631.1 hypothetical protein [Novosphingobium sp.]